MAYTAINKIDNFPQYDVCTVCVLFSVIEWANESQM